MQIKNQTEIQLMKILFKTSKKKPTKNITSSKAYPHGVEAKYYRQLKSYFKPLTDYVKKYLTENIDAILRGDSNEIRLDAIPGNSFDKMIYNLENWLSMYMPDISQADENKLNNVILLGLGQTAEETIDFSDKEFEKMLEKGIHVNVPTTAEWWDKMKTSWMEDNYTLITSNAKNYVSKINSIVEQGVVNGQSVQKVKDAIFNATQVLTDKHCKLLARDQIGKLTGQIEQAQMQEIGLELYIWDTSMDDRVRESHALMQGLLCRWDDASVCSYDGGKTWEPRPAGAIDLHPGQDIQCRCSALAFYPELISEIEGTSMEYVDLPLDEESNMMANLTESERGIYNNIYDEFSKSYGYMNNSIDIAYSCATGDFTKIPTSVLNKSDTEWKDMMNKITKALEVYDTKNMVKNEFDIARNLFLKGQDLPKFVCTKKELQDYIAWMKQNKVFDSYEKMFSKNYGYEKYFAFARQLGTSTAGQNTYYRGLLEYLNLASDEFKEKSFSQFVQTNSIFTFSEIDKMKYFDDCLRRANISIGQFNIYDFVNIQPAEGFAWGTAELTNSDYKAIAMFDHKITPFDKMTQELVDVANVVIDSKTASQGIAQKLYCEQFYPESKKLSPLKLNYLGKTYKYHNDEFLRLEFSYNGKSKNYKVGQILKQTGVFATTPSELHNAIWYESKLKNGATNPVRFHLKRNKLSHKYLSSVQIDDLRRGVYTHNNPEEFDFSIGKVKIKKIYDGYINGNKNMPVLEIDVEIVE